MGHEGPLLRYPALSVALAPEALTALTAIRPVVASPPRVTAALELRPGVPVRDVWHTSIDQDGEPYELTRFVMRGDMTGLLYDVPVE